MFVDCNFLKLRIKQGVLAVFFFCALIADAKSEGQLTEKVDDTQENIEIEKNDKISAEDAEEIIEYNIYRKNHPENPCARDLDTYD